MLLDPGHNRGYIGTMFQLKRTWRLWTVQLVLIVAVVEVFLHEDSFHFSQKSIGRTKRKTPVGK